MRIVPWLEWLDDRNPYYDRERHAKRFLDNPPQVVLVVDITDRQVRHKPGPVWDAWTDFNERIQSFKYDAVPLFLERDTLQEYYWAFWDEREATLAVLQLVSTN